MPITRTNAVSHKKKKITTAVVKIENSKRMNAKKTHRISKRCKTIPESEVVPISNPNTEIILIDDNTPVSNLPITEAGSIIRTISSIDTNSITNTNNESMANESVSTSDTSTSSSNLPKNKKRAFYCVGKDQVNMSFRLGVENYSNMIPQISKEIYSNFSYQYKKRIVPHRSTRTSKVNDTAQHNNKQSNGVTTSSYSRCYVEDFMTRKVGESILLLVPTRYLDDPFTPWYELISSDIPCSDFSFTKQSYRGYIGTIITNPKISQVSTGMHISDYSDGFGNHNHGSNVMFGECDHEMIAVLVTWKHVLEGKRDGIMVWREEDK